MKIIGFAYINGIAELILKGDSALLNNRKPLFVPDWTQDLRMTPGVVVRISRLGKHIGVNFANRYYDAVAPCVDFMAYDILSKARQEGKSWVQATSFDFSLAIGEWNKTTSFDWEIEHTDGTHTNIPNYDLITSIEGAIHLASEIMTLRQGDMIYIQQHTDGKKIHTNEIIQAKVDQETKLQCKIK